jgi:hypothetical protein
VVHLTQGRRLSSHRRVVPTAAHRSQKRNDPFPTYLRVLNVACDIYPESREQTDTLEQALRRLPGVNDLPSTVPSEDAVRD